MTQIGKVVSASSDVAQVEIKRASACGENCAMCKGGCMPTRHIATVKNPIGAEVGDMVKIIAADSAVLKSAFLVYIMPLVIMFVCYGVVYALIKSQAAAALAAVLGLVCGFFALRAADKRMAPMPEITQVL